MVVGLLNNYANNLGIEIIAGDEFFEVMQACRGLCVETSLAPILGYTAKKLGCQRVSVVLRGSDGRLYTAAAVGMRDEYLGESMTEDCVSAAVMKFGNPACIDMRSANGLRRIGGYRSDFYVGIPLFAGRAREPSGVLNVTDADGYLDKSMMNMLALISVYVSQTIGQIDDDMKSAETLLRVVDKKDHYTAGHCRRVTEYSDLIAGEMQIPKGERLRMRTYGLIHDLGKIGVPDAVLNKPGRLTDEEFAAMKMHPNAGCEILDDLSDETVVILQHHDRWDGSGYGTCKKGEDIHVTARILACADAWDAMTSDRPYRPAMPINKALAEIRKGSGTQFDPSVTDAFLRMAADEGTALRRMMNL